MKTSKHKKILKISLLSLLALIALLAAVVFALWLMSGRPSLHRLDSSQLRMMDFTDIEMPPPSLASDALYLVELIENTHPIFVIEGWLPPNYETMRDEFLARSRDESISNQDFIFAMLHYFTALRDGHMNILATAISSYLDINWQVQNDRLFLLDEDGMAYGVYVNQIGGTSVSEIFATIARYYYSENEFALENSRNRFSAAYEIISRAGGNIDNDMVQLNLSDGTVMSTTFVERNPVNNEFIMRHEMIGDIFLLDIRTFTDVPQQLTEETVQVIENAIESGTRHFIIDVRGNNGGSSWVAQQLLNAMGIRIPQVGAIERFSQHDGMWHFGILNSLGFDYSEMSPRLATSRNRNDVHVSVLTDAGSFSTAMWMAMWVQDGGFGNVIGSPSRNAPTSFGNVRIYSLPYSDIWFAVSSIKWMRPDANNNPTVLMPDILVEAHNALEVALEYLQNLDD